MLRLNVETEIARGSLNIRNIFDISVHNFREEYLFFRRFGGGGFRVKIIFRKRFRAGPREHSESNKIPNGRSRQMYAVIVRIRFT